MNNLDKIDFKKLNNVLKRDRNDLKRLDKTMAEYMFFANRYFAKNTIKVMKPPKVLDRNVSEAQMRETVLEFFENVDSRIYKDALEILSGKSDVAISIYDSDSAKNLRNTDKDFPTYVNNGMHTMRQKYITLPGNKSHFTGSGAGKIYIPRKNNISDYYLFAHELSHNSDASIGSYNHPRARTILGEFTPSFIESILDDYLLEKNIISENESTFMKAKLARITTEYAYINTAKFDLINFMSRDGEINQENFKEFIKNSNIDINDKYNWHLFDKLLNDEQSITYTSRYVIADFIMPTIYKEYKENPKKTIEKLHKYFEKMKQEDLEGAIDSLDLKLDFNSVNEMIINRNNYVRNINGKIKENTKDKGFIIDY